MSTLKLTSDTLAGTPAAGEIEYNGQFFGADSNNARAQFQRITLATAQNSTSGTSIDFTGIPAWVKKITVMFQGVSTSGTSNLLVQLGSGTVTTTGYVSYAAQCGGTGTSTNGTTSTAGMVVIRNNAADTYIGSMTILNVTSNSWVSSHNFGGIWSGTLNAGYVGGGNISLSGTLDRIRITTINGTDTFDAGSINIIYEG